MRKFFIFLNKFYNKNKKKIILVVLIVAFFLVFMREADRYIAKENSSSVNNTTTITDIKNTINDRNNQNITDNIVSREDVEAKVKELNNDEDVIKMFIEFCKKRNVDNAYNMISDSCKKTLFTTQKEFSEKYYNTYFSNQTIIKISKYNDNGTYKVDYSLDPLITGSSENSKITDYITITKDKKLNVGGFIKNVALNKKTQNSYVKINVISKDVFWDHENYNVELDNLISAKIYLDTKSTERNSFVSNENNTCYYIDIDNYDDSDLEVQGNKSKKMTLKFNKKYNENDEIVTMNFNNIVIENYEYGDKNSINKNDILEKSGETTYERKYTTYPEKVTLRVDFK